MNNEPKSLLTNIKLLKLPKLRFLRSKSSYFFSQIKSSRSSSLAFKNNYKFSQLPESRVKNTNFSSCLFNQAHKIDPSKQTYLPSRIETPDNRTKIKTILIQRSKTLCPLKSSKTIKTKSLNRKSSNFPGQIFEKKHIQVSYPKAIVSLSSLTMLIMNQCQGQIEQISEIRKINKKSTSGTQSIKCIKIKPQNNREHIMDNPYELLSFKKAIRCKENRKKESFLQN